MPAATTSRIRSIVPRSRAAHEIHDGRYGANSYVRTPADFDKFAEMIHYLAALARAPRATAKCSATSDVQSSEDPAGRGQPR